MAESTIARPVTLLLVPRVSPRAPRPQASLRAGGAAVDAAPLLTASTKHSAAAVEEPPAGLASLLAEQNAEIIRHLQEIRGQGTPVVAKELQVASRSPISMVITNEKQSIQKAMRRMLHFELYNAKVWRSTNALVEELLSRGIVSEQQLGAVRKDIPTWRGRALAYVRDRLNTVWNGPTLFEVVRALSGLDGARPSLVTTAMAEAAAVWRWKADQARPTSSARLDMQFFAKSDRAYRDLGEAARQRILEEDLEVCGWTEDGGVFQATST
ncbi:hypothetical protein K470DRAFT_262903 [Piedraia hortae CBS 480.64]|uniref:Uncharacterized protein n=1 Tax=Piedraia hortae CBS 480.64 TaxID=1314780 RepID=A0A6A7C5P7_9PEZI|nr:hypothetical protein K470DRAFT_262903 [Piedraia hortae CBS 480.64]